MSRLSELTLTIIKLGFLALLWLFVLSAASVIRADLFGTRVESRRREKPVRAPRPAKPPRRQRGAPSRLVVTDGVASGEARDLADVPVTVGRGGDCALQLDDDYVSTRHARFVPHDGAWYVEDLGSTNGTYVAGRRVTQPTPVSAGAQVRIGKTVIELRK